MQTLLFDPDGTLTDSREGIVACIGHALECLGEKLPPDATLDRFIGPPLEDGFAQLLGVPRESDRVAQAVARYR